MALLLIGTLAILAAAVVLGRRWSASEVLGFGRKQSGEISPDETEAGDGQAAAQADDQSAALESTRAVANRSRRQPRPASAASIQASPAARPSGDVTPIAAREAASQANLLNDESWPQEMLQSLDEAAPITLEELDHLAAHVDTRAAELLRQARAIHVPEELINAARELTKSTHDLRDKLQAARHNNQATDPRLALQRAGSDMLTGLPNRGDFNDQLARRIAEWRRRGTSVSLMMVEIDGFRRFGKTNGRQAAQAMLRGVGQVLSHTMRDMDVVTRFGREVFAVILPSTNLNEARKAALRALAAVRASKLQHQNAEFAATISVGVAQAEPADDAESLAQKADEALDRARSAGRNCGYFHQSSVNQPVDAPDPDADDDNRRYVERRGFTQHQHVAVYDGRRMPHPDGFEKVLCLDISTTGIGFIHATRGDWAQVIVALGAGPRYTYMKGEVLYCLPVEYEGEHAFRVGCRFTGRLSATKHVATSGPQAVSAGQTPLAVAVTSPVVDTVLR